jgi:hypothetical protein
MSIMTFPGKLACLFEIPSRQFGQAHFLKDPSQDIVSTCCIDSNISHERAHQTQDLEVRSVQHRTCQIQANSRSLTFIVTFYCPCVSNAQEAFGFTKVPTIEESEPD